MHSSVSIQLHRMQAPQSVAGHNAGVSRELMGTETRCKTDFSEAQNTTINHSEAGFEELATSNRYACTSRSNSVFANQRLNMPPIWVNNSDTGDRCIFWKDISCREVDQSLRGGKLSIDVDSGPHAFQTLHHEIKVCHMKRRETFSLGNTHIYPRLLRPLKKFCRSQGQKTVFFGSTSSTLKRNDQAQNELNKLSHHEGLSLFKTPKIKVEKTLSWSRRSRQPTENADYDKHGHAQIQTPEKGLSYLKNERVVVPWSCKRRTAHSRGCTSQNHRTMTVLAPFAVGASSPLVWLYLFYILLFSLATALPKHHNRVKDLPWTSDNQKFELNLNDSFPQTPNYGQSLVMHATAKEVGGSQQLLSPLNDNNVITNDRGFIQETRADDLLSAVMKGLRKCCGNSQKNAFSNSNDLRSKLSEISKSSSLVSHGASAEPLLSELQKQSKTERLEHNQHRRHVNGVRNSTTKKDNWRLEENTETRMSETPKLSSPKKNTVQLKHQSMEENALGLTSSYDKTKQNRILPQLQFSLRYNDTSVPSFPEPEPTNRILERTPRAIFPNFTKADLVMVAGVATDLINWLQATWTHSLNSLDRSYKPERTQSHGSISGPGNFGNEQSNFLRRKLFTGKHDAGDLNFTKSSYLASNRIVPSWSKNKEEYADDGFLSHRHDEEKDFSSWKGESYEEQSTGHSGLMSKPILIKHRDLIEGRQLFGLGFFTGTLLNFFRDPVVLFLIFWFNLWISYAGIATFYNGFTFVTSFFSGDGGGTTTTMRPTSAPIIPSSSAALAVPVLDPPVTFIIEATARPPSYETDIPSPPSTNPDGLSSLASPPSTVTENTSLETEVLDPLGFSSTLRPPITKPPDLLSTIPTIELTLSTDDTFTLSSEASSSEGTTDELLSSVSEIPTDTIMPDDGSPSTDVTGTDLEVATAETDSNATLSATPSTVQQDLSTLLAGPESESNGTIIPVFVSINTSVPIDPLSFYTTMRPAVTKPSDVSTTKPSIISFIKTSTTKGPIITTIRPGSPPFDLFTFYTTKRPIVTKPIVDVDLSYTEGPAITNSRPGSSTLDVTFFTTKRPTAMKPTKLVTQFSTLESKYPITTRPVYSLTGSSTLDPFSFITRPKPIVAKPDKLTSKPLFTSTSSVTRDPLIVASSQSTYTPSTEYEKMPSVFVTMPSSKETTYASYPSTKSTPAQTSFTTMDPVTFTGPVKPLYFMTPAPISVSSTVKPGTQEPLTLVPLLLNLTNNLALDLLGLNSTQFSIPVAPSIHFKPEFPYKPFLNQSIILTDSFLQYINETKEKTPTITTEIIRNLTTLLSHIYNGSSEGFNSSELWKPSILQLPMNLINSSEAVSSGSQHSTPSVPKPDMSVITAHLQSAFGSKKPHGSGNLDVSELATVSSGSYMSNAPTSSEATSQSLSPHTEAPILVLDRCLSSGGSLAQCLELSQLYGKLFEAVMGDSEHGSSTSGHISGIPISSNSTLIQDLLKNSTYSQTSQISGGQSNIPDEPNSFPNKQQSIVDVINNQLLPGAHHPYPEETGGLFAVGHGSFETLSPHKQSSRPLASDPYTDFTSSSNNVSHESLNVQTSLKIMNASQPLAVPLSMPQGTLLVAPIQSEKPIKPEKPSLSVPLISDHELIPLHPLPEEPLYGTTASGSALSDFDYYLTGFADSSPSLNSKESTTSEFEINTESSSTSLEEYYHVYWTDESSKVTPEVSNTQSDSHSRPRPQNVDTATLSPHIQALVQRHPHANVIIGPPPKHIFQKTGTKHRLS